MSDPMNPDAAGTPAFDTTAPAASFGAPVTPVTADAEAFSAAGAAQVTPAPVVVPDVDVTPEADNANPGVTPKSAKFERPGRNKRQKAAPIPSATAEPVAGQPRIAPTVRVTVAATSFDFLEGGYNKLRRLRLVLLASVGGAIALMLAIFGAGLTQQLLAKNINASINDPSTGLVAQANRNTNAYNQATQLTINGKPVNGSLIKSAAVTRGQAIESIVGSQANMIQLLTEIMGLGAHNMSISGIIIVPSPTAGTGPTKIENVTFTATIPGCADVSTALTQIKSLPGFSGAVVTVPGCTATSMTLTVQNQVTDTPLDASTFNLNVLKLGQ